MNVIVLEDQSLFDIAVQACGSVESIFEIARLNGLAITDILPSGMTLAVPDPTNKLVAEYYEQKDLRPATDVTAENMDKLRNEGIDYWAVDVDFVVQ